jgi:murein DD-endopeptidase MepM/ murein hydrolase activator NlpD
MKKRVCVKIIAVLLFCTVLTSGVVSMPSYKAEAVTQQELEARLNNLKEEEERISAELNKVRKDVKNQKAYQTQLSYQISNMENQITALSQRIGMLDTQISEKTAEIERTQKKIDESFDLFKKRLRAMYMSNDATVLSVLFGSSTFAEFLSAAETTQRIADHDDKLIKELTAQKQQIEADKATIEQARKQIEADKAALESKQNQLNQAKAASTETLISLQALEKKTGMTYRQIVAEMEKADAELQWFIQQNQGGGELSPGGWLWPVAGYTRISDGFGNRILNGVQQFHKGIDIPAAYGHPVRAAKSGVVIRADFSSSYGNIVVIDHGGGFSTAYAHNSSLKVSQGQVVSQGQTIALVGSTGWSYGNHCLFEVRINGVVQNPLNYVRATG